MGRKSGGLWIARLMLTWASLGETLQSNTRVPIKHDTNPMPYQVLPRMPVSVPLIILVLFAAIILHPGVLYAAPGVIYWILIGFLRVWMWAGVAFIVLLVTSVWLVMVYGVCREVFLWAISGLTPI